MRERERERVRERERERERESAENEKGRKKGSWVCRVVQQESGGG